MRNKYLWAAISWTVLITVACLVSASNFKDLEKVEMPAKDKLLHAFFYFVFTLLWYLGLRALKVSTHFSRRVWAFTIAVGYGIIMEVCQALFTDSRSADAIDAIANSAGSAIAVFALWRYQKRKINSQSPAY
ncbi:VanZ family protein [Flavobacterium sp. MFBS3-15]|uniref:VanZ family protein n=1 Tax=Flavobacterium sp. MFBS3-15 TaxID=2989816 RepID=UPI0022358631|nr:VanZ family protein [Flavobacterium sp. MFBS3-15]MCW4468673.1 VanZ family protein [Flavobacterium sp. MFBS3-15]